MTRGGDISLFLRVYQIKLLFVNSFERTNLTLVLVAATKEFLFNYHEMMLK